MTAAQRAGQLLMVGLQPTGSSRALAAQVKSQGLGGVIYLGGWSSGATSMATISARLQASAADGLLVAADQEGGQVQQLRGSGLHPDAVGPHPGAVQRRHRGEERRGVVARAQAGPASTSTSRRSPTPCPPRSAPPTSRSAATAATSPPARPPTNARYAAAFVRGTLAAGIAPTVKHFPGLGRITGNTDVTSNGITDRTTSADDPYLAPFEAGIEAGAPLVMISSARYPKLDPDNQAMFS